MRRTNNPFVARSVCETSVLAVASRKQATVRFVTTESGVETNVRKKKRRERKEKDSFQLHPDIDSLVQMISILVPHVCLKNARTYLVSLFNLTTA